MPKRRMDELLTLLDYTAWATVRLFEALETLSANELERDLSSSHGGILGTLAHLYGADLIWTARLKDEQPPASPAPTDLPPLPELLAIWLAHLEDRRTWIVRLHPNQLVTYVNLKGEAHVSTIGDILRHSVNHSTYHRGQIITMLRQLGHGAVNTDLIVFFKMTQIWC